jgi:hypothetical protein
VHDGVDPPFLEDPFEKLAIQEVTDNQTILVYGPTMAFGQIVDHPNVVPIAVQQPSRMGSNVSGTSSY